MKTISILLLLALSTPLFAVSTVPEPETIFYGRVVNRSEPQDYLLTAGSLRWTISQWALKVARRTEICTTESMRASEAKTKTGIQSALIRPFCPMADTAKTDARKNRWVSAFSIPDPCQRKKG